MLDRGGADRSRVAALSQQESEAVVSVAAASISVSDVEDAFRAVMIERGLTPPDKLIPDGKLHRCDASDKPGKRDGAYLLFLDDLPAGGVENWRDGRGWQTWCARDLRKLSPSESAAHRRRMDAARRVRDPETEARAKDAAGLAARIWAEAGPAVAHPYLERKRVEPHGLRISRGKLVVPVCDADGVLHSLQFIGAEGEKRFLKGARKKGCYFVTGELTGGPFCIAEGFATAATIYEMTEIPTVVAFDSGNLQPVAEALRKEYPNARITIAADDDFGVEGNPGLTKATAAARAVGALLAAPDFGENRPGDATDINDLLDAQGPEAVRRCIESAVKAAPAKPPTATATTPAPAKPPAGPKRIMMSTIQPKATAWLCEGRIQAGAIISMEGLPGSGKSTVATELVACVTTGRPMFGDVEPRTPKGVIWIGHEERLAESIRPRLDAAGADASKVAVYQDPPEFPRDCDWLENEIMEVDAQLVIADPIDAYLTFGGQSSSNNNADVRSRLLGLSVVADRTGATIVMIRHHRKAGGIAAVYRGAGSLAYSAVARTIICFCRDPDDKDRRVMSWSKMNEAKEPSSLVFSIGDGRRVVWLGEDDRSAQEMMDQADERGGNREPRVIDRAVEWMRTELADGPRPSREVEKAAKDAGISRSSYDRARAELGVKSERRFEAGEARWYIYLTARASGTPPISDIEALEALEALEVVADVEGPQETQGPQESTFRGPEALGDQEVFS